MQAKTFSNITSPASQVISVTLDAGWIAVVGVWIKDPSGNPLFGVPIGNPNSLNTLSIWIGKFQQLGTIYAYGGVQTGTKITAIVYYI